MFKSKPRIFVSSTIYDFADLRSALKYWLNEMGFDVFMSEYNDFKKDSSCNSYNACLKAIQDCDYYILLIGSRVGGLYSENPPISITQKEYQEASKLFDKGKIKKILTFVRKDIWTIKEDRKALHQFLKNNYMSEHELSNDDIKQIESYNSSFVNDANFIFSFIKEVGKIKQMKEAVKGNLKLPDNNWINTFSSFEDIITVLKIELNIHSDLSYKRWSEIVIQELSHNLSHLMEKHKEILIPFYTYADNFYKMFPEKMETNFEVTKEIALETFFFVIKSCIHIDKLNSEMLKGAIQSGTFLQYDNTNKDYKSGNIQSALYTLIDNIESAKRIRDLMQENDYLLKLSNILQIKRKCNTTQNNKNPKLVFIIALYNNEYNIIKLSKYLFSVLKFGFKTDKFPSLKPMIVFKDNEYGKPIQNNTTLEDIYNYFVNNPETL